MDDTFSSKNNRLQRLFNDNATVISAIVLIILSVLELLAFKFGGVFSYAASRLWLFGFFVVVMTIFAELLVMLYQDIRRLYFFTPCCFALLLLFLIFIIGNLKFSNVSYEAAMQAAEGLNSFKLKDFNYTGTGFLGYPARQYLLNALPSLLFGRSIISLEAGFAFPFILGLCACYVEARHLLRKHRFNEAAALLPILLITSSPYIVEFYLIYEQSINPVSFTMLAIAFYLRFKREPSVFSALALAWVGNLLYNSYSPGASTFMLLFALLGLDMLSEIISAIKKTKASDLSSKADAFSNPDTKSRKSKVLSGKSGEKSASDSHSEHEKPESSALSGRPDGKYARMFPLLKYLPLLLSLLCSFLAVSMAGRKDNLFTLREDISLRNVLKSIMNFYTDGSTVFLSVLSGLVLIYSLLSFAGLLGLRNFVIACWTIATVLLSEYLVGYKTDIDMHLLMQRSMIVIPVLCFAIFAGLVNFFSRKVPKKFLQNIFKGSNAPEDRKQNLIQRFVFSGKLIVPLISIMLYFVMISRAGQPHHAFAYMNYCQALKYTINTIEKTLDDAGIDCEENFTIHYYTDSAYASNLYDYTGYFFPNALIEVFPEKSPDDPDEDEIPNDADSSTAPDPYERTFTFYYGAEPPKTYHTSYKYHNPRIGQDFTIYYI